MMKMIIYLYFKLLFPSVIDCIHGVNNVTQTETHTADPLAPEPTFFLG